MSDLVEKVARAIKESEPPDHPLVSGVVRERQASAAIAAVLDYLEADLTNHPYARWPYFPHIFRAEWFADKRRELGLSEDGNG